MKHFLILILLTWQNYSFGQSFYDLLSETLDETYLETTMLNKRYRNYFKGNIGYYRCSMPYKFHAHNYIEKYTNMKHKNNVNFLYNYDTYLGKDTIKIISHIACFYKTIKIKENEFRHNFSKLKWKRRPSANAVGITYLLKNNEWLKYTNIKDMSARWYTEIQARKRQKILDLNKEALIDFIGNISKKFNEKNLLIIENTLGIDFFLWEYNITHFPYMVASQEDLTRKVLKKYKTLVGWCSIDLNGNTISIQLRAVDSEKYKKLPDKENIDDAVIYTQTYQFRYCDEHGKWCMVK